MVPEAPRTRLNQSGELVTYIGFTGPRVGMSPLQQDIFKKVLEGKTGEFHHGDCVGSDAEAHDIIRKNFADKWRIIIHPPVKNAYRAFKLGDEVREAKPYFPRNQDIVVETCFLIATPKSVEEVGGTWYTINYLRNLIGDQMKRKVPITRQGSIILPNGTVGHIVKK